MSTPPADHDSALLHAIRHSDREAFASLFREWYPSVVRFVYRYVKRLDLAEDLAQDVFITLWERRGDLDPSRSFKGYLYTIARNRALNAMEHERVVSSVTITEHEGAHAVSSPMHTVATTDPGPAGAMELDELIRIAEARVATLSPRLREIYHLTRHDGLAPAEVAEVLGSSVQTVYKQVAQIVKALHPILDRWRYT